MKSVIWSFAVRPMILGAIVLASACSHQPKRIDCDKGLEPINAATPPAAKTLDSKAGEP
jgi:hypothetical protein